jgi:hypothetical protein
VSNGFILPSITVDYAGFWKPWVCIFIIHTCILSQNKSQRTVTCQREKLPPGPQYGHLPPREAALQYDTSFRS